MGSTTPEIRRLIVRTRRNGKKVNDIADMFNVSRWTVWRWRKRAHHRGRESFKDKSRRPHVIHRKVTPWIENTIIFLRDSFDWGTQRIKENLRLPPSYLQQLLEERVGNGCVGITLSRQTINEVLKKHNRNGYPPGGKREWKRFRADSPNDAWQMDIKGPFSMDGEKWRTLVLIDDFSSYMISNRHFPNIDTNDVISELNHHIQINGKPGKIITDKDPRFKETLLEWCADEGIDLVYTPPRYPQAKGKVERGIRNYKEEFLVLDRMFERLGDLSEEYRNWYNNCRFHLGVNNYPSNLYLGRNVADLH